MLFYYIVSFCFAKIVIVCQNAMKYASVFIEKMKQYFLKTNDSDKKHIKE